MMNSTEEEDEGKTQENKNHGKERKNMMSYAFYITFII